MNYRLQLREARLAYDRGDWQEAASRFSALLTKCGDPSPLELRRKHAVSRLKASIETCRSAPVGSDVDWITIAIPTYNRRARLMRTLGEIEERFGVGRMPIIVSDNGSTDGTYETVRSRFSGSRNLRIQRHETNQGFANNYCAVLMLANTPYTLLLSDEDELIPHYFDQLQEFLAHNKPVLVSPLVIRGDKRFRGHYATGNIASTDFWESSFYISGLIYSTSNVQTIIEADRPLLTSTYSLYPQCLVAATLLRGPGCYWSDLPLVNRRPQDESYIHSEAPDTATYNGVIGRWRTFLHTEKYLLRDLEADPRNATIQAQIFAHYSSAYRVMRAALGRETPHLLDHFDAAARAATPSPHADRTHTGAHATPQLQTASAPSLWRRLLSLARRNF